MTAWPEPPSWRGAVRLVPLVEELLAIDTAAYLASPRAIAAHSAGAWPGAGFTVEDNRPLLAHHQAEHEAGYAFAYALLDRDEDREVGCAYLRPLDDYLARTGTTLTAPAGAAVATFGLLDDATARPGTADVLVVLREWIAAWGAAPAYFRCLPEERETVAALSRALPELAAAGQPLGYRWFGPA